MAVSIFELFSIGIGPSSSHTVGPMRAARQCFHDIHLDGKLEQIESIRVDLYGSLAATGEGHCTDMAILLGMEGHTPEGIDPDTIPHSLDRIRTEKNLLIHGARIPFDPDTDLIFNKGKFLPFHSNAMRLTISLTDTTRIKTYYSVGGGFIVDHDNRDDKTGYERAPVAFPYQSAEQLLSLCSVHNMSIADVAMENEQAWRDKQSIRSDLLHIYAVMEGSITRGCQTEGILPGSLQVKRRAPALYTKLMSEQTDVTTDPTIVMDWVSLFALAVNEENAAGGRIVTAPTNGAAGVIPAVLKYYTTFIHNHSEEGIITFLLTAGAICQLYKANASISAAEVGCQGEVGVACSLAAAGLTAALGGTNEQIEHAAEIGMEHNLGLTCDPIAGLVQIPCIERNTMGAIKAINAARLALREDGQHHVSLDEVIATMLQTGKDMSHIYKETSEGGLALYGSPTPVSVPEC